MLPTNPWPGLHGQLYRSSLVAKVPAALFECELCPWWYDLWRHVHRPDRRILGWDHCHTHGVIRGVLCIRCNRTMADVDAGLSGGWVAYRKAAELLRSWRMRCPQCTDEYPTVGSAGRARPPAQQGPRYPPRTR